MKRLFYLALIYVLPLAAEENFILIHGTNLYERGTGVEERVSPCSTFKIALCLMGFDSGVLVDENTPIWPYEDGYDDFLATWKQPQTPQMWMKHSCIWYSKILARKIGALPFQNYLAAFNYGNQNSSGGLTTCHLSSSLKISPKEQAYFIQKMLQEKLPVPYQVTLLTKKLLFIETLPNGWKLYGKTGLGKGPNGMDELGWFVGWVEREGYCIPFAYNIIEEKVNPSQRIPRAKEFIFQIQIMTP